ncbi:uncharacterized protein LOC115223961 [Argonauta hians]
MFKINDDDDDDDEFWKEFPLETFDAEPISRAEKRQQSPLPAEPAHKKLCSFAHDRLCNAGVVSSEVLPSPSVSQVLNTSKYSTNDVINSLQQREQSHKQVECSATPYLGNGIPQTPKSHHQTAVTPETSSKRTKRIFPGPAGILPKLVSSDQLEDVVLKLDSPGIHQKEKQPVPVLAPSQSHEAFNERPWRQLVSDLGQEAADILKKFSIKEIHRKASKKLLCQGKVLLLFSILDAIDFTNVDASVHLRDRTGIIQGTLHRNLVKEYRDYLQPGTVLVLKQVGVISPTLRSHYLNITSNNLVSLYSVLTSGEVDIRWQEANTSYSKLVANAQHLYDTLTPSRRTSISSTSSPKGSVINSPGPLSALSPSSNRNISLPSFSSHLPSPSSIPSRVSISRPLASSTPVNFQSPVCDTPSKTVPPLRPPLLLPRPPLPPSTSSTPTTLTPRHHQIANFQRNPNLTQVNVKAQPNSTVAASVPGSSHHGNSSLSNNGGGPASLYHSNSSLSNSGGGYSNANNNNRDMISQNSSYQKPNSNSNWTSNPFNTASPAPTPSQSAFRKPSANATSNPLLDSALSQLRNSSLGEVPGGPSAGPMAVDKGPNGTLGAGGGGDKYRLHPTLSQNGDSLDHQKPFQDDLWQDDLTDDILSQISEDIF